MPSDAERSLASGKLTKLFESMGEEKSAMAQSLVKTSQRCMKYLALPLVSQMGISSSTAEPVQVLDNCCGSGVVTQEIQAMLGKDVLDKSSFICGDNSAPLVGLVERRIEAEGWLNAEAKVLDAKDTGLPDSSLSHVAIALGLHLIPGPDAVLKDCQRILKPGGIIGATTFPAENVNHFWFPDVKAAFASFPFDAPFPTAEKFPMQMHEDGKWSDAAWIEQHLGEVGFTDVEVNVREGNYMMSGPEEYMDTFGMMLGWLMSTWWSEDVKKEHPMAEVRGLMTKFLEDKYQGKPWNIDWLLIVATAKVEK